MPLFFWRMMANGHTLVWCLLMADIPRLDERQRAIVRKLIRQRCCNYDNGSCLLLDWPFCNICPQWISHSLNCKWFRQAVLPNAPELEGEILGMGKKRCTICGNLFVPRSNRAQYCAPCSIQRRRDTKRFWARKKKHSG